MPDHTKAAPRLPTPKTSLRAAFERLMDDPVNGCSTIDVEIDGAIVSLLSGAHALSVAIQPAIEDGTSDAVISRSLDAIATLIAIAVAGINAAAEPVTA